jgi:hypothetical protein
VKYVEQLETGGAGGDSTFGYNMKKNEAVA